MNNYIKIDLFIIIFYELDRQLYYQMVSQYKHSKKTTCKNKFKCNNLLKNAIQSNNITDAHILDGTRFGTTKSLLNTGIKKINCIQGKKNDLKNMKQNLYRNKKKYNFEQWNKVSISFSKMNKYISNLKLESNNRSAIYYDGMATWDSCTWGTSIHNDFYELVKQFHTSTSDYLLCAITVSTRNATYINKTKYNDSSYKHIILNDMLSIVNNFNIRLQLNNELAYPSMYFIMISLYKKYMPQSYNKSNTIKINDDVFVYWKSSDNINKNYTSGYYKGVVCKKQSNKYYILYEDNTYDWHSLSELYTII